MAGMGPAPKHPSVRARRNASPSMTHLPGEGRRGRAPKWPLLPDVTMQVSVRVLAEAADRMKTELESAPARSKKKLERELAKAIQDGAVLEAQMLQMATLEGELWDELWATPQAVQWERLGWNRDVAQYVRWKVRGELGDLDAAKEARQWSDRLGLNPLALLRLRWEIDEPAPGAAKKTTAKKAAPRTRRKAKGDDPRLVLVTN